MILCTGFYAGRNYGNVNVTKAAGGYIGTDLSDIGEYATPYSLLSDCREWENVSSSLHFTSVEIFPQNNSSLKIAVLRSNDFTK